MKSFIQPKSGPKSTKKPPKGFIPDSAWDPPEYLSERAKAEYQRVAGILADMGRQSVSDPRLVELYAINMDLAQSAYETLLAAGLTVTSDRGNVAKHPLLESLNAATVRVKGISTALGITPTPADLARVETPTDPAAKDPSRWDGILRFGGDG